LGALAIDVIYPGHGEVIRDPARAIRLCRDKLQALIAEPARLGTDHLRKIMVFTLMMRPGYPQDRFFDYLMTTHWYPAVVDRYFEGSYEGVFAELIAELTARKLVLLDQGSFYSSLAR
jgi:hypothetical protein